MEESEDKDQDSPDMQRHLASSGYTCFRSHNCLNEPTALLRGWRIVDVFTSTLISSSSDALYRTRAGSNA